MTKTRYQREPTQREQEFARLADDARKLRQEIQSMVRNRRRSDVRHLSADRPPEKPKPKKTR
jgi:hypothetical protein